MKIIKRIARPQALEIIFGQKLIFPFQLWQILFSERPFIRRGRDDRFQRDVSDAKLVQVSDIPAEITVKTGESAPPDIIVVIPLV